MPDERIVVHSALFDTFVVDASVVPLFSEAMLTTGIVNPDGSPATNRQLVETIVTIARTMGRQIATPDEARRILCLDPAHKDRILTQLA